MKDILFQQLFESESSTFTYLLADHQTREAVIIDPVLETYERDIQLIGELNLKLLYILETHIHADHVTGAARLAAATGAKIGISAKAQAEGVDWPLKDGDQIHFGSNVIQVLETPGHTDTCQCYLLNDRVFTGDTLLIRGNGRTDFQQGSPKKLYDSVTVKLFALSDETIVYPAHDYKGFTSSTIGIEKKHNVRLGNGRSLESFTEIMNNLKLAQPKKIDIALPANLKCGRS